MTQKKKINTKVFIQCEGIFKHRMMYGIKNNQIGKY